MPLAPIRELGNSLNFEVDPEFLGLAQYQLATNVDMDRRSLKKRPGLATFFSGISGIPMLIQDFVDVTNTRWIMVATTTKVYTFQEASLVLTDRTPAGYSTAIQTSPAQGVTFQFKWFLTNGQGFWYWDGVAATLLALPAGSPQSGRALLPFGNHLQLLNVVTSGGVADPYKIAWSDFLAGTVWTTGDALSVDIVDGNDAMMGAAFSGRTGVIFKTDSVWVETPIPSPLFYQFDRKSDYSGCIATATIANIPGMGVGHLWRDDYYVFDGVTDRPISAFTKGTATMRKDMSAKILSTAVNAAFTIRVMARQKLLLFIPNQTWTQTLPTYDVYVLDWYYRTLTKYDYSAIPGQVSGGGGYLGGEHIFAISRTFSGSTYAFSASPYRFNDAAVQATPAMFVGGVNSGKVYREPATPVYTDDGNAYISKAQTGMQDFSNGEYLQSRVVSVDISTVTQLPATNALLNVSVIHAFDAESLLQSPVQPLTLTQTSGIARKITGWADVTNTFIGLQFDDALSGGTGTVYWEIKSAVLEYRLIGEPRR
jgi:hypothetical protein